MFVGVRVGVRVGVFVGVPVAVLVPVAVGVAVFVGVKVAVGVSVAVWVGVQVAVSVAVGVTEGPYAAAKASQVKWLYDRPTMRPVTTPVSRTSSNARSHSFALGSLFTVHTPFSSTNNGRRPARESLSTI